jgi:hypothetical protein
MTVQEFYQETLKKFEHVTDLELIASFNREVGNQGWGSHRGAYLGAIHKTFLKRGFDISEIGNEQVLSFKRKVELIEKKLIPLAS